MKKGDKAKTLLVKAVNHPTAGPLQIHQVGRQLQAAGDSKTALEVFQINAKRNGEAGRYMSVSLADSQPTGTFPKLSNMRRKH